MKFTIQFIAIIALFITSVNTSAQDRTSLDSQSEELGKVRWFRDYDKAISKAKEKNKEIVLLFQEVPGCSTCRNYGHNVLSHPLMVEAIEDLFIPLAIFNNKSGKDREILNKYNEPTWNNPVVRIINSEGVNVVKRIGNDYSALTLCRSMKEALKSNGKKIPKYLDLLEQELLSKGTGAVKEKYYKMYCFWTGEKQLGKLPSVASTQSGFIKHNEVVKVLYDSNEISEDKLDIYAKSNSFTPITKDLEKYKASSSDIHYYLQHSPYIYLPLTEVQKTKINSALGQRKPTEEYLSPTQRKWLIQLRNNVFQKENVFNVEFIDSWNRVKYQANKQALVEN